MYNLTKTSFYFKKPQQKKLLFFDEAQTNFFIKKFKINKNDYYSLNTRKEKINIYILLNLVKRLFSSFRRPSNLFLNYLLEYIKSVNPSVVITLIDNNILFFFLKKYFPRVKFLTIQLGHRTEHRDIFTVIKKKKLGKKNLKADICFTFNKAYGQKISNYIKCKTIDIGSLKNNFVKIGETKKKKTLLFISQFRNELTSNNNCFNIEKKLLPEIKLYCEKEKINFYVLGAQKINSDVEKKFFTKIIGSNNWKFLAARKNLDNYREIDKFENIVFIDSTLGYEAIGRKKKVAIFSSRRLTKNSPYEKFAWPFKIKKRDFFYSNSCSKDEVKRVLDNVTKCSEKKWKKEFLHKIKKFCPYKKNNLIFRKKIISIINK